MSTEVICALIAAGGALLSAVVAWFVSRAAANKEIERLKLTWAREDVITSDEDFAAMCAAVSRYVQTERLRYKDAASALVSSVRSKEDGVLADSLDCLYASLKRGNSFYVDECLTKVIEEKRKAKRHAKSAD